MEEYPQKCAELKERLRSTQKQNEVMVAMIERTKKMIQRARLERALLLEKLDYVANNAPGADDQDFSPPQSPVATASDTKAGAATSASAGSASAPTTSGPRKPGSKLPNAYTVFCDEERATVIKALEDDGIQAKPPTVQRNLSEKWKSLSKEQKKPYSEKAKQLKENKKRAAASLEDTEDEPVRDQKGVKEETDEPRESRDITEEPIEPASMDDMKEE